ncbi:hypothetical protein [Peribacillus frigoritolerans]|uniref:hypothetical protein n=1 Tax=Peribacillus frigoritolerans TaxID=450367 RepID=UPI0021AA19DF|nr:hypothetical protein [Peribacillus frigoritolerans]
MKPAKEDAGGTWEGGKLFHIGIGSCTNMEQKRLEVGIMRFHFGGYLNFLL